MRFDFKSFRAVDDIVCWQAYMEGHADVLRTFGITSLTSHKHEWLENPNVYVIVAFDENQKMVGGIKLHSYHPSFKLPVEIAIGEEDSSISKKILESQIDGGAGEICGLWIALSHGRLGLAHYLSRSAIAICNKVKCKDIYGISSPFTLNMFLQLGYQVITDIGENGNYSYPTPEFISTAVKITNTFELESAQELHRTRVKSLRTNPIQTTEETLNGMKIEISYNLMV